LPRGIRKVRRVAADATDAGIGHDNCGGAARVASCDRGHRRFVAHVGGLVVGTWVDAIGLEVDGHHVEAPVEQCGRERRADARCGAGHHGQRPIVARMVLQVRCHESFLGFRAGC
jgi:hypothetical protein